MAEGHRVLFPTLLVNAERGHLVSTDLSVDALIVDMAGVPIEYAFLDVSRVGHTWLVRQMTQ